MPDDTILENKTVGFARVVCTYRDKARNSLGEGDIRGIAHFAYVDDHPAVLLWEPRYREYPDLRITSDNRLHVFITGPGNGADYSTSDLDEALAYMLLHGAGEDS